MLRKYAYPWSKRADDRRQRSVVRVSKARHAHMDLSTAPPYTPVQAHSARAHRILELCVE